MEEINLSEESVQTLCRLCLKTDDFIVDIFHGLDGKSDKEPLPKRIYDLYAVKVEESDGLPKNICHRCLYLTESFTSFRLNVKQCEEQLKAYSESMKAIASEAQNDMLIKQETLDNRYEGLNGFHGFVPDKNCEITVVDPNQECESSDDCFSMEDSDTDFPSPAKKTINGLVSKPETANEIPSKTENVPLAAAPQNYSDIANEPKNTFLCQYCDMAFTTQMNCDEHESRHDAANPFICNFCPFRTVNRQVLIHHIKESHDNERPFVCTLCNKGFCRRSDLKKHTIVHTGVRPYSCPVCSKSFSRNTNLTKHMRIHSGIKPHVCQKCPRSFTTYADLIRHQRAHTEIKPHKCTKCTASFTRKDKLQKHYISHLRKESESGLYDKERLKPPQETDSSQIIDKSQKNPPLGVVDNQPPMMPINNFGNSLLAAQLQKPQAKMQIRTGTNPFEVKTNVKVHICNICSRTFTRKREFQRHQALHLDCLYKCKQCDKNFNRRDKLIRHEKIFHAPQYNCNLCNMSYTKLEALQMHVKVHDLHNNFSSQAEGGAPPHFNNYPKPTPMALGFYSEIKPEE
ncbi:zinc finger protein 883 [Eupeodes corollae]|uniref:zinc finger protein 883 n=1 Tax=Eupeodes corollae TaxID=290404 RepID=UPI002493A9DF|nr:zinc finger protein 883 [Eupeodes corollae]